MCQPTSYFAIAARLLKGPVSTSRRISLQISISLCTPVPLSERGRDRGYRPDPPLLENGTVVRHHFGPPSTASGNDALRLTGRSPISGTAAAGSIFDIYYAATAQTYLGGLFTDLTSSFGSAISGATFNYFVRNEATPTCDPASRAAKSETNSR